MARNYPQAHHTVKFPFMINFSWIQLAGRPLQTSKTRPHLIPKRSPRCQVVGAEEYPQILNESSITVVDREKLEQDGCQAGSLESQRNETTELEDHGTDARVYSFVRWPRALQGNEVSVVGKASWNMKCSSLTVEGQPAHFASANRKALCRTLCGPTVRVVHWVGRPPASHASA
jgi:hypothetical protein